jgi:hypothetical protein
VQGHVRGLKSKPYGLESGTPEEIRAFRGNFFYMEGVGSVESEVEILFHDSFQDEAQMLVKTYEQGIVIKGKIPDSALPVPVQNFNENLARIVREELRVQKPARTVFTPVRAPGGACDRT